MPVTFTGTASLGVIVDTATFDKSSGSPLQCYNGPAPLAFTSLNGAYVGCEWTHNSVGALSQLLNQNGAGTFGYTEVVYFATTSTSGGAWSASIWSAGAPTTNADVTINGHAVTVPSPVTTYAVRSLTFAATGGSSIAFTGGCSLSIRMAMTVPANTAVSIAGAISVQGTLTLAAGSTLTLVTLTSPATVGTTFTANGGGVLLGSLATDGVTGGLVMTFTPGFGSFTFATSIPSPIRVSVPTNGNAAWAFSNAVTFGGTLQLADLTTTTLSQAPGASSASLTVANIVTTWAANLRIAVLPLTVQSANLVGLTLIGSGASATFNLNAITCTAFGINVLSNAVGPSVLSLSGTFSGGQMRVSSPVVVGVSGGPGHTVTLAASATLVLSDGVQVLGEQQFTGAGSITTSNGVTIGVTAANGLGVLLVGPASGTATVDFGALSGATTQALQLPTGTGVLRLAGTSGSSVTVNGALTLPAGTTLAASVSAVTIGAAQALTLAGTLRVDDTYSNTPFATAVTVGAASFVATLASGFTFAVGATLCPAVTATLYVQSAGAVLVNATSPLTLGGSAAWTTTGGAITLVGSAAVAISSAVITGTATVVIADSTQATLSSGWNAAIALPATACVNTPTVTAAAAITLPSLSWSGVSCGLVLASGGGGATLTVTAPLTMSGAASALDVRLPVTLSGATALIGTLTTTSAAPLVVAGTLTVAGGSVLALATAATTLVLNGAATLSGTISGAGVLQFSTGSNAADVSAITVAAGATTSFDVTGSSVFDLKSVAKTTLPTLRVMAGATLTLKRDSASAGGLDVSNALVLNTDAGAGAGLTSSGGVGRPLVRALTALNVNVASATAGAVTFNGVDVQSAGTATMSYADAGVTDARIVVAAASKLRLVNGMHVLYYSSSGLRDGTGRTLTFTDAGDALAGELILSDSAVAFQADSVAAVHVGAVNVECCISSASEAVPNSPWQVISTVNRPTPCNSCSSSTPCQHGGACYESGSANNYTCACAAGFNGAQCQTDVNECASNPCQHGGICTDGTASFTCTCMPGYEGALCATDLNECASNPCLHGATCVDGSNSFTCTCAAGYEGARCATDRNECASNPCANGGTCVDGSNSFTCTCPAGFQGVRCATNVNECVSNPCQHGATCVDGSASFSCTCAPGYEGALCATDLNECASNPCLHGATCVDGANAFTCTCAAGFQGVRCATDLNECASNPCQHGATCVDGANAFACTCAAGYTGVHCETNVNECASNPCRNGAVCADGLNSFTCACASGYSGTACQTNVNECSSMPCRNGASCVDGDNGFHCACDTGYFGTLCERFGPDTSATGAGAAASTGAGSASGSNSGDTGVAIVLYFTGTLPLVNVDTFLSAVITQLSTQFSVAAGRVLPSSVDAVDVHTAGSSSTASGFRVVLMLQSCDASGATAATSCSGNTADDVATRIVQGLSATGTSGSGSTTTTTSIGGYTLATGVSVERGCGDTLTTAASCSAGGDDDSGSSGFPRWAAIVIGVVGGALLLACCVLCFAPAYCRQRKEEKQTNAAAAAAVSNTATDNTTSAPAPAPAPAPALAPGSVALDVLPSQPQPQPQSDADVRAAASSLVAQINAQSTTADPAASVPAPVAANDSAVFVVPAQPAAPPSTQFNYV